MKFLTKHGTKREPQMGEFEALESSDRVDLPAERRRAEALSPESPLGRPLLPEKTADDQPEMGCKPSRYSLMASA
jgi:hypothetical protein